MINEGQQEQASLYVLGSLNDSEREAFEGQLLANEELRELVSDLQHATVMLAQLAPQSDPSPALREKIVQRISGSSSPTAAQANPLGSVLAGLRFESAEDEGGWKPLPVRGAWIKLLSLHRDRGYAVLLGKLEPGVRYPAHRHDTPEDLIVLSGDLQICNRRLGPGDFHHADAGSEHGVNYSVEGCTLLAVLDTSNPLVSFALA